MFREFWPPQLGLQQHADTVSAPRQVDHGQQEDQRGDRQRGKLFAVVSRPVRLFGRGIGATASGVGSVVQKPVRAARHGFQRRDSASEQQQPEPAEQMKDDIGKRAPWDGLMENVRENMETMRASVKGGLEGAKELMPRGGEATSQQLLKRCFPVRLSYAGGSGAAAFTGTTHDLAAAGSRLFGLSMGRAKLQVKIYDFALYFDAKQAKNSQLAKQHSFPPASQPEPSIPTAPQQQDAFAHSLRSSPDIDMSLVVRASRNLPLRLMMGEYERILRRRLKVVGGLPDDPALAQMLAGFREEHLPKGMVRGGNVQKGSVLTFTRAPGGKVIAAADGHELAAISSPAFAAAVFDLYVGDQPVSPDTRLVALDAAARMMATGSDGYAPAARQPGVCEGGDKPCLATRGRHRPWQQGSQLQPA